MPAAAADAAVDAGPAVAALLDGARLPALVFSDRALDGLPEEATVVPVAADKPEGHFRTVVLVADDPADLRRQVTRLGAPGWARVVGVVLADTDRVATLRPDPSWPRPTAVEAEVGWTRVEFDDRLEALPVLHAFARSATPTAGGHGGLRVARTGDAFDDPSTKHPPDVVVAPPSLPVVSESTGRAPVVVAADDLPDAVDEGVYNPVGFRREWTRPVVDLPADARLGPSLVRALRDAQAVRPTPRPTSGRHQRLVAGLAMSGVPLLLGDADDPDQVTLDDPWGREELSVRRRRAALSDHSTLAARARLAATTGVRVAAYPTVSVLLTLSRPDRLRHALAQVARQRCTLPGAEVELVLAAHGFTPDSALVRAAAEPGDLAVTIVPATTDSPGELLRPATAAASGDVVLALDADDWYGPDVVTDLLLARRYSGADVVGTPTELVFDPQAGAEGTTVRHEVATERYGAFVAGGTTMIDRVRLHELGGWRPGAHPATELVGRVERAGGLAYATHGLGHVRRGGTDHAAPVVGQWPGFRPSALVEA
jgi:hypothetical protein